MENREEVFIPSSTRQARILELENYSNFELAEVITSMEVNVVQKDVDIAQLRRVLIVVNNKLTGLFEITDNYPLIIDEMNWRLKDVHNSLEGLFELTGEFMVSPDEAIKVAFNNLVGGSE
jgi:uncharacterized coiled-coil protein SlyX